MRKYFAGLLAAAAMGLGVSLVAVADPPPVFSPALRNIRVSPFAPIYRLRVHLIITADDGQNPDASQAAAFQNYLSAANAVYFQAGVQFLFDPAKDVQLASSTLLNNDFPVVISGPTFKGFQMGPGIFESKILNLDNSKNPHHKARLAEALKHSGELVIYLRSGVCCSTNPDGSTFGAANFGTLDAPYMAVAAPLTSPPKMSRGALLWANVLAHEIGHYFGLSHTYGLYPFTKADAETMIAGLGNLSAPQVLAKFDGDGLPDTPPDPGATIFESAYQLQPYHCGPQTSLTIGPSAKLTQSYTFYPDRTNIMSYFFRCPELGQRTLSLEQAEIVRKQLETGVRKDLTKY